MEKHLKGLKDIIDAEEYSTGGILDRAKEAAVGDENKEVIQDIVIASRCKKHKRSKASRRR